MKTSSFLSFHTNCHRQPPRQFSRSLTGQVGTRITQKNMCVHAHTCILSWRCWKFACFRIIDLAAHMLNNSSIVKIWTGALKNIQSTEILSYKGYSPATEIRKIKSWGGQKHVPHTHTHTELIKSAKLVEIHWSPNLQFWKEKCLQSMWAHLPCARIKI